MRQKGYLHLLMRLVFGIAITSFIHGGNVFAESPMKQGAASRQEVRIERRTPAYWRITFDIPPFNIFGPETIPQLNEAITQLETDPPRRRRGRVSAPSGVGWRRCSQD